MDTTSDPGKKHSAETFAAELRRRIAAAEEGVARGVAELSG
ncbi:hypothetical protein [Micromonospora sp. CP22]|nr:hypothetical protein [Micromonospora sp. CP22]